jgi:general L-amino acid transport system substrate-binding protein
MIKRLVLLLFMLLIAAPLAAQEDTIAAGPTLAAVQARGQVICGVNEEVFGFGFLNPNTGAIDGLQIEFCRALAAATIGEAGAISLRLVRSETPPAELVDSDMDVLFNHGVAPTLTQAAQPGYDWSAAVMYYDGVSVMARGLETWEDLSGVTICMIAESDSALAFETEIRRRELSFDPLTFATLADMRAAFFGGQCNVQVLEHSLLEIIRQSNDASLGVIVWSPPFNRLPLRPLYRYGDQQWADIVDWTLWGLVEAEKLGITSENVARLVRVPNEGDQNYVERVGLPVARLLDATLGLGRSLGLTNDFMAEVIAQVGNYGEIYARHLGPNSQLPIPRGLNELSFNDGLIDSGAWR